MPNEFIINHLPNNTIEIEGKTFHFFSGTSYLSMNQDTDFQNLFFEGVRRYGMSFGSSRNGNLQLDIFEKAEQKLAAWVGSEAALTLSSGMLAGQVVAQFFSEQLSVSSKQIEVGSFEFNENQEPKKNSEPRTKNSELFYAPHTHAANLPNPNIQLPKISFEEWSNQIVQQVQNSSAEHCIIVCNSVDALRCTLYHFDWTIQLPENKQITLIIDDSHGLGITGENGSGIFRQIKINGNVRLVVVSSLHKAMGIAGGVVFADKNFIEAIRHTAYFASCSPIAPAYLYAYLESDEIYQKHQAKLAENIQLFLSKLSDKSLFNFYPNYPVFYTDNDSIFEYLYQHQIFIYSFAYPIKTAKPNTRIVISAWHEPHQIEFLAEKCNEFQKLNKQ